MQRRGTRLYSYSSAFISCYNKYCCKDVEQVLKHMSKGGIMPSKSDGSTNHLFTNKWKLGKTTNIRIPIALKDELLEVARYYDKFSEYKLDNKKIIDYVTEGNELKNEIKLLETKIRNLESKLNIKSKFSKSKDVVLSSNEKREMYKAASQCFDEYLDANNIEILEDKKPRKGSLKRQLFDIKNWFIDKSKN